MVKEPLDTDSKFRLCVRIKILVFCSFLYIFSIVLSAEDNCKIKTQNFLYYLMIYPVLVFYFSLDFWIAFSNDRRKIDAKLEER